MGWSSAGSKNIPLRDYPKSPLQLPPSRAHERGVSRSSRTLGAGCDGRGSVGRATESQGELRLVSDRLARRRLALKRLRRNLGRQHMSRPKRFGGGSRGRQRRVVLAPVAGVKLMETCRALPGFGRSPIRQRRRPKEFGSGESALYALKPLRREGRVFRRTLRSPVCILCARSRVLEGTRLSLRPLRFSRAKRNSKTSGAWRRGTFCVV